MADIHGIFHSFECQYSLQRGGWDGEQDGVGWGGVGGGEKPWLGHLWSSHDAHILACALLVGHRGSHWEQF